MRGRDRQVDDHIKFAVLEQFVRRLRLYTELFSTLLSGCWNDVGNWGATIYLVPTPADVEKPVRYWKYDLDFLPWMNFQNDDFLIGRRYVRDQNGFPQCN